MQNIFDFSYSEDYLRNLDGSASKFRGVYGEGGNLVVVPKGGRYNVVQTEDVSAIARALYEESGLKATPFIFKSGEVIGLNVNMGNVVSKVGDRQVFMRLNVKNNGTGVGYLGAFVKRLICSNGAMRTEFSKDKIIKIPHTRDYNAYLKIAQDAVVAFNTLIEVLDAQDLAMDSKKIEKTDLMFHLNKWFFEYEYPTSQRGKMTFNEFRLLLVEKKEKIQPYDRYRELMNALDREIGYNAELGLKQSVYTAYAAVSNYLSRRIEKSGSGAPIEIVQERALGKLDYFSNLVPVPAAPNVGSRIIV